MKWMFLLASLFIILLSACDKDTVKTIPNGKYEGTFIRTSPTAKYEPANVTITIDDGRFTGSSDKPKYPAICSGTFKVEGSKITVNNECMFTADFDWSFIFNGEWEYEVSGDELKLVKRHAGSTIDYYTLKKR